MTGAEQYYAYYRMLGQRAAPWGDILLMEQEAWMRDAKVYDQMRAEGKAVPTWAMPQSEVEALTRHDGPTFPHSSSGIHPSAEGLLSALKMMLELWDYILTDDLSRHKLWRVRVLAVRDAVARAEGKIV